MLIHAGIDIPLCLHTHVFDKTTGEDISNIGINKKAYAFKEWDTVTKQGLIHLLDEKHQPMMDKYTHTPMTKYVHFPNAETVFIIPNKNMVEIVAIKLMQSGHRKPISVIIEDVPFSIANKFDPLSLMVAEAMDEPEAIDVSFRSATHYNPEADKKRKGRESGKDISDYIEIL